MFRKSLQFAACLLIIFLLAIPIHPNISDPILSNTKYLMYLPHSGLNNQRIALGNAIVLSKLLNRTLIIPPLFIGRAMPKQQFKYLYFTVKRILNEIKYQQQDRRKTDILNWNSLFNLKELCQELDIPYIVSNDYFDVPFGSVQYLLNEGNCKYTISDSDDVATNPFRINSTSCNSNILPIEILQNVTSSILFMDSMFGSTKIAACKNENSKVFNKVHRHLQLNNDNILYNASRLISVKLGQFIGIHYRANDKQFKGNAEWLMGKIIGKLNKYERVWKSNIQSHFKGLLYAKMISLKETFYQKKWPQFIKSKTTTNTIDSVQIVNRTQLRNDCILHSELWMFQNNTKSPMILYVATDVPDPINHPQLQKLMSLFPCTFFLNDFHVNLDPGAVLLRNASSKRLMPIIDQYVISMGNAFIGYDKSTFSKFSWLMYLQNNNCDGKMNEFNIDSLELSKALPIIENKLLHIDATINSTEIAKWLKDLPKMQRQGVLWEILGCGFSNLL